MGCRSSFDGEQVNSEAVDAVNNEKRLHLNLWYEPESLQPPKCSSKELKLLDMHPNMEVQVALQRSTASN